MASSKLNPQQALERAVRHANEGEYAKSEKLLRPLLSANRGNGPFLQFMGLVLNRLKRHAESIELCRRAVELQPGSGEAMYNFGTALMDGGQLAEAVAVLGRAAVLRPTNYDTIHNLGFALGKSARLAEAERTLRQAIALNPAAPHAYETLGAVLEWLDRNAEALDAYDAALVRGASDPAEIHAKMGRALVAMGRGDSAQTYLEKSLAAKPGSATAAWVLGGLHQTGGRHAEAVRAFELGLKAEPANVRLLTSLAYSRRLLCDWRGLDGQIARGLKGATTAEEGVDPLVMLTLSDDPVLNHASLRRLSSNLAEKCSVLPPRPPKRRDRIRVGYVSGDLRMHAVSTLTAGMFERHDRSRFEIYAFSFGADDGSAMRKRLEPAFDHFIDASVATGTSLAGLIREHEIDIAVDLMGYTGVCRPRALALRPAPIQVNYLGYPGTYGADWIDYILADAHVAPTAQAADFSERIVHLPDSFMVTDDRQAPVGPPPSRAQAGLPEAGFVFACFNASQKLSPEIFDVWMKLLAAVPGSVLWLARQNETIAANLKREATRRGIDNERIVFAGFVQAHSDHMARIGLADLFLDTRPYGAHTTAVDALWAGVPVLTCTGQTFASRVGASLLTAIGLSELITSTLADYQALALRIATDRAYHSGLRARLAANRTTAPLFDTARFTRHIEAAYEDMMRIWLTGDQPKAFAVRASDGGLA